MTKTMLWTRALRYGPAGAAVIVAAFGIVAALQFAMPETMPAVLPLSGSYYAHALSAKNNGRRMELARKTVDAAPGRAENWLLLASAYQRSDKRLSGRVLASLRQSYIAGALSPDAHDWRLAYIFSNWRLMPPDLKAAAMTEADTYIQRYTGYVYIKSLAPTLSDDEGRVALGLVALTHDRAGQNARRISEFRARNESVQ